MPGIKVVAIGGGTGLPVALKSIKEYATEVTAIVSVADDGGSSGRLRRDLGMLPPGDIRNCLVALAGDEPMAELFKYRFKEGIGITGHNLGNLIIAALTDMRGGFDCGIKAAAALLDVEGRVLPSTIDDVILRAATYAGDPIEGQARIATTTRPLKEVYLDPPDVEAYPAAVEAILEADQVIMGPGSVFTSILPNLIVGGIGKALAETSAIKIYICNVMTQPGETDLFTAYDHIGAIFDHGPKSWVDVMIINSEPVPEERVIDFAEGRRYQVSANIEDIEALGVKVILADVLDSDKPSCHSSQKLAAIVRELV